MRILLTLFSQALCKLFVLSPVRRLYICASLGIIKMMADERPKNSKMFPITIRSNWPFLVAAVVIGVAVGYAVFHAGIVLNSAGEGQILLLNPRTGPPGTMVTVHGISFFKNMRVRFEGAGRTSTEDVSSTDAFTLQFSVPQTVPGTYFVSVVSPGGLESKQLLFTVTSN